MSYKTILVHVDSTPQAATLIEFAAEMAINIEAHLVGLAATGASSMLAMSGNFGEESAQYLELLNIQQERTMKALDNFESVVRRLGVHSFERRVAYEEAGLAICLQARYADLVVIGQTPADNQLSSVRTDFPQYVLLNCGRPVLMLPCEGKFSGPVRKIVIAWDASAQATRAVTAAIPLLRRAERVEVLILNPEDEHKDHGEQPGNDIAIYLARHGVKVDVVVRNNKKSFNLTYGSDTGEALLSQCDALDADMMVMGAYVHSRMREFLQGGVTKTILSSMTLPVLLAH